MSNTERYPSQWSTLGLMYAGLGYVLFGALSTGAVVAEVSTAVNGRLEGVQTPLSRFANSTPQLTETPPPQPSHQLERLAGGIASTVIGSLLMREGYNRVFTYAPTPQPAPGRQPLPLRPAAPELPARQRPEEQ